MNYGQKIEMLKESRGFRDYKELGTTLGLSNDWLRDQVKKDSPGTIDIARLIIICNYFNVSLDWLIINDDKSDVKPEGNYDADDIGILLDNIKMKLNSESNFYGLKMNNDIKLLTKDAIDEVKNLIKENL